jgi:hypothetical protein
MRLYLGLFVAWGVTLLAACQEKTERSAEPAASVDKNAAMDPAVAKAMAAASAQAAKGAAPSASGGPPPNGIFAPGAADKELTRGAAPKLTLGGTGSEPRVSLGGAQPKPGWKASGSIQLVTQADPRQGGLPIDLGLTLDASKPAGDATEGGAAFVNVTAKVTSAKVGVTGVPRELEDRIGSLKGARVTYQVAPDGSGSNYKTEGGAGAAEVKDQLRMLEDALALVTLPRPAEPVGVGAVWMATSRDGVFGLDLVTYRLIKVEEVAGNNVTLSIGTKRYAASDKFSMAGLEANAPKDLLEFQARSDGRLTFAVGAPFPQSGEIQSVLGAALGEGGQQRGVIQIQSRIGLDFRKK